MTERPWPKERDAELRAMKEAGISNKDIADRAGVSEKLASYHLKDIAPLSDLIDILPSYPKEMLRIPDRPCMLTADWHVPYYDPKWLRRLVKVSQRLGVKDLAIVGDFADESCVARFVRLEQKVGFNDEMKAVLFLLRTLLLLYDDVWWCYGNHEDRLPQALHGQDMLPAATDIVAKDSPGRLHTTNMKTMLLGDWRLEHPKKFSPDAAKVAAQCAAITHTNVACAHGHHFGSRYDVSGQYLGIDLGGLFDVSRQEYLFKTGATTLPTWNPGFWVYANGKVKPFADAFVDWPEYGAE
jgi:hypothetical protein